MLTSGTSQTRERAQHAFSNIHPVSELQLENKWEHHAEIATLGFDEIAAFEGSIYNKKDNLLLGGSTCAPAIEWADDTDWCALKDKLANKVK